MYFPRVLLAVSAALACSASAGCATSLAGMERAGLGAGSLTTAWDVGSCHRLTQLAQTDPVYVSDTSPAVPCTTPHQSETFADAPIPASLTGYADRPSPELLNTDLAPLCGDKVLAAFLGRQTPDTLRDVVVRKYVPSVPEWRAGKRFVRCDALVGPRTTAGVASVSQSLRGLFRTPLAARFRVCRLGLVQLSCDQLHDSELADPPVVFSHAELASGDHAAIEDRTKAECRKTAETYLGAPLASRPDLTLEAEPPADRENPDSTVGRCWLGQSHPFATVSGSVRRPGV